MDEKCSIVQDLLPLYAEDMVRSETGAYIEAHLAACADCRGALAALRAEIPAAPEVNAAPLRGIAKELRRQKLTAVLLAVALALALACSAYAYLTAPQYLSYDEVELALSGCVTIRGDNAMQGTILSTTPLSEGAAVLAGFDRVQLRLTTPVSGVDVSQSTDENGKVIYSVSAWRTLLDAWRGKYDVSGGDGYTEAESPAQLLEQMESSLLGNGTRVITLNTENCAAIYYAQNNDHSDVLLLSARPLDYGGMMTLPRLALGYYLFLALVLGAALGCAWCILRRKRVGKTLGYFALAPLCYAVGHLLVKGFSTESYNMPRDFSLILLAGALIYCAALAGLALRRRKRAR